MDTQRLLRLFGICFTAACLLTTAQGFHIEMPASVSAVEGSCVMVPCKTTPHTRVIWYKYQSSGWPAIYDGNSPGNVIGEFRGRTTVQGHASEGNCTLRIDNVKMSDGITLYPYINPESDKYYKPTVQIKTHSRTQPEIRGPKSPVKEGEVFSLSCSVQHSCPPSPPAIEWRGLKGDTTEVSTERNDLGVWVDVSTVTVNATRSQHGKKVHCRSMFPGVRVSESTSLTLDIAFLSIMVPNSSCSEEGRMMRCVCWVEAHPVATVTWMLIGRTELPASVFPKVTTKGTLMASEVELEGTLAEQGLVCVAKNIYSNETHQLPSQSTQSAKTLLTWIILASVFGLLGLCGIICYSRRKRNSGNTDLAVDNIPSRPRTELGVKLTMVQEPAQNKLPYRSKTDQYRRKTETEQSVCATEIECIYKNDNFLRTQYHRPQTELDVNSTGPGLQVQKPEENEWLCRSKTDESVCAMETEDIYLNDHFLQTQYHRSKTDESAYATETEDIYDNDDVLQTQFHREEC